MSVQYLESTCGREDVRHSASMQQHQPGYSLNHKNSLVHGRFEAPGEGRLPATVFNVVVQITLEIDKPATPAAPARRTRDTRHERTKGAQQSAS